MSAPTLIPRREVQNPSTLRVQSRIAAPDTGTLAQPSPQQFESQEVTNDFKSQETSGDFNDQGNVNADYQVNPWKYGEMALAGVKPAIDIANIALQKRSINNMYDKQMGRTIAPYQHVSTEVQAAQDLPAEVLAQQARAVGRVRSNYRGSDPVMDMVANQMAQSKRADMRTDHAAQRAQFMTEERRRVAEQNAANQLRAGDVNNKNIDRRQQLDDYKLSAGLNKIEQNRKLVSNVATQLGQNIDNRAAYNTKKSLVERQNKASSVGSTLSYYIDEKNRHAAAGTLDPAKEKFYNDEISKLSAQNNELMTTPLESYDRSRASWASFKNGGKLIPRG